MAQALFNDVRIFDGVTDGLSPSSNVLVVGNVSRGCVRISFIAHAARSRGACA